MYIFNVRTLADELQKTCFSDDFLKYGEHECRKSKLQKIQDGD
jgi:hypothetical protein